MAQESANKKREYFNQLNKEMDMKNQQREMERMNREAEARGMQQKLQEQQMLTEAMREQEKALKANLANLNRRQIEEYQEKLRIAKLQDQAKGMEMAQQALAQDQLERDLQKKKKGDYSEALRKEVDDRSKMRQLDQILQVQ